MVRLSSRNETGLRDLRRVRHRVTGKRQVGQQPDRDPSSAYVGSWLHDVTARPPSAQTLRPKEALWVVPSSLDNCSRCRPADWAPNTIDRTIRTAAVRIICTEAPSTRKEGTRRCRTLVLYGRMILACTQAQEPLRGVPSLLDTDRMTLFGHRGSCSPLKASIRWAWGA